MQLFDFVRRRFRWGAEPSGSDSQVAPSPEKKKSASKPRPAAAPDAFEVMVTAFQPRIEGLVAADFPAREADAPVIAFLITPWLGSAVPMFSLELALLCAARGVRVVLLLDDTDFAANADNPRHCQLVREMTGMVSSVIKVVDVAALPEQSGAAFAAAGQTICDNIAIWWGRGESGAAQWHQQHPGAPVKAAAHLARVRTMLASLKPSRVIIPGGFFGLSAVYRHAAGDLGIDFTTYDSNDKLFIASHNAVAGHYSGLQKVLERVLATLTTSAWESIQQRTEDELAKRKIGKDDFQFQLVASSETTDGFDVLLPLNLRWDAAALGAEKAFPSSTDWLRAVLSWIREEGHLSVCLREHPAGRMAGGASSDDVGPIVEEFRDLAPRLRHYRPEDAVNTYSLISRARVVLPYTSTVGIEAALMGRPVITHTTVYYRNMGFGWNAETAEEYFRLINEAVTGRLVVDEDRRRRAMLAYHLTQNCCYVKSPFNPNPNPYHQWVTMPRSELSAEPGVQVFVDAITTGEELSYLMHHRMISTPDASAT